MNLKIVLLGIILGALTFFAKGTAVMLGIIVIAGFFLWKFLPAQDKGFLLKVFITAISVRIFIFTILYLWSIFQGGHGEIMPDSRFYFQKALYMTGSWRGQAQFLAWTDERSAKGGFLYILSLFYLLIGYSPVSTNPVSLFSDKLINCLIGSLTSVPIFYLCKDIFGRSVAKIASSLVVFFPSLILWSMTNNRDTINIFLVCLILFFASRFQKRVSLRYFILCLPPLLLLSTIRLYIFYFAIISIVATFLILVWMKPKRKVWAMLIFIAAAIVFLTIKNKIFNPQAILERLYQTNEAVLSQGGSMYKVYDDALLSLKMPTTVKLIVALLKGWFYFLLVPFPWSISSMAQLLSYPQMIIWYLLLPFIFIGIIFAIRYKLKDSLMVLIYLFIVTSAFALIEGNVGSALRHRDLVSPLYFIFAAVGIIKFLKGAVTFEESK